MIHAAPAATTKYPVRISVSCVRHPSQPKNRTTRPPAKHSARFRTAIMRSKLWVLLWTNARRSSALVCSRRGWAHHNSRNSSSLFMAAGLLSSDSLLQFLPNACQACGNRAPGKPADFLNLGVTQTFQVQQDDLSVRHRETSNGLAQQTQPLHTQSLLFRIRG